MNQSQSEHSGQHTPTPWHRNIRADGRHPIIWAGRNTHIAQVLGHKELPAHEIEANIDYIVNCVNNYDALQSNNAALVSVLLELVDSIYQEYPEKIPFYCRSQIDRAMDALGALDKE